MEPSRLLTLQPERKTVTILGSTGSIGRNTVDLIKGHPEKFQVRALTAYRNVALLAAQAEELGAEYAVIGDETLYPELKQALSSSAVRAAAGKQAVCEAAEMDSDWTMAAIVGAAGVMPTLKALLRGKTVALANKESIVCAGKFIMDAVRKSGAVLLPVDSEHNAIFQVFDKDQKDGIRRIILTASGGPFLRKSRSELDAITPEEAVRHPNWSMGAKISVDSATMMNKSLEIIEASYLFNLKSEYIDVVIHPQSIVHSMVEYVDGSILAQMGAPDMRTPIAYTMAWPQRIRTTGDLLNLGNKINFSFEPIDTIRFPAVELARGVLRAGPAASAVFNAANEAVVQAFLNRRIRFSSIENIVEQVLQTIEFPTISGIDDIFALDAQARRLAEDVIQRVK